VLPALLAVSTALLVACAAGEEEPGGPLVMEPAPAKRGTPIDLDLPRDPSGAFAFDRWPKACGLLTDADIKAVLPQATEVRREPEDQKINLLPEISNDVAPAPPRMVTAKGASCRYVLQLPAAGLRDRHDVPGSSGASLRVSVDYAGTPTAVKKNLSVGDDKPIEVPDGRCYGEKIGAGVSCRKGSLAFSVNSDFQPVKAEERKYLHRYRVKGKTTTFTAGDGTLRSQEYLRDHLSVELAKAVLAKI